MNSRMRICRNDLKLRLIVGTLWGLLATSCTLDPMSVPGGDDGGCDACSAAPDAGDGGLEDAGMLEPDAGDSGLDDAGMLEPDAGDAGLVDAGADDAGADDAGADDAGADDAGPDDAGLVDAGCDGPCLKSLGESCKSGSACESGFCVDSVCCDSACNGVCQSCTALGKGSGINGTCGAVKPGTDPSNDCTGVCDAQGQCVADPGGWYCGYDSECMSGNCFNGICCADPTCLPIDSCHLATCAPVTGACTNTPRVCPNGGTCANNVCPGQCTGDVGVPGGRVISGPAKEGALMKVTAGDVDNDGDVDILASYFEEVFMQGPVGQTGILRNMGNGTFGPWENSSGLYGSIFFHADVNNDGFLDLVFGSNSDPKVLIRFNDGTGKFPTSVNVALSPMLSGPARKIVLADVNNDGYRDLIICGSVSGALLVSLNAGGMLFGAFTNSGISLPGTDDFEAADLDADGRADLVYSSASTGSINVRFGVGNGSFGAAVNYAAVTGVNGLELRDVNADGKPDAIATNGSNTAVRLNLSNGSFGALSSYLGGSASLADLNGDGHIDILGATSLFNNGNGTFVPQSMDYVPHEGAGVGDINGDGLVDLVRMTPGGGAVTILRNQGNGLFPRPYLPFNVNVPNRDHLVFVDLNGDNRVDLATLSADVSQISVKLNMGNGNFGAPVNYSTVTLPSNAGGVIEAADMNGDGKMDLVVSISAKVVVFLNMGNGAMAPGAPYFGSAMNGRCSSIGDVNGDGYPDVARLVPAPSQNNLEVLLNQGDGTLGTKVTYASSVHDQNKDLVAVDLNGDGYSDFVVHGTTENVSIYMNNTLGAAVFQYQPGDAFGWLIDDIAVGDVNGDGYIDVAYSGQQSDVFSFGQTSLNDGHGVFSEKMGAPLGVGSIADLDGNGLNDLIAYSSGLLCLSLNKGTATTGCYESIGSRGVVADIDADGIPEIIKPEGVMHKISCSP